MSSAAAPHLARDPFALTANPAAYVATPAHERALAQMLSALEAGRVPVLSGPTGLGKTLLLQVVSQRVRRAFEPLYVPYATLPPHDLAALALGLLERDVSDDPPARLLALARTLADEGRPLLLLVDDAGALPRETGTALAAWLRESGGGLRLCLAGLPGERLRDASHALGDLAEEIPLTDGLPPEQLGGYVAARLAAAGADPSLVEAFDTAALDELERVCEGNPRKLHLAAQAILRSARGESLGARRERHGGAREGEGAASAAKGGPEAAASVAAAASRAANDAGGAFHLGEYRYVRGRLVDPRTGEPAAADEEVPVAEVVRPREPAVERPGATSRAPSPPSQPDFSVDDDLESFDPGEGEIWAHEPDLGPEPAPPREPSAASEPPEEPAPAARERPPVRRRGAGRAAPPPPRRRAWPGWIAAAIAGMAFGIGLATQLDELGPRIRETTRQYLPGAPEPLPAPAAPDAATVPAAGEPRLEEEDLLDWAPPPLPGADLAPDAAPPGEATEAAAPVEPERSELAAQTPEAATAASEEAGAEELPGAAGAVAGPAAVDAGEPPGSVDAGMAASAPASERAAPPSEAPAPAEARAAPPAPAEVPAPTAAPVETVAVAINATPWAVIEIDGREVGETPLAGLELPVGRHRFVARMPDGTLRERVLRVDAENDTVVFE